MNSRSTAIEAMKLDPLHILWQKNLLDHLAISGKWGIPNGGAVIQKIAKDTVFIESFGTNKVMIALVIAYIEAAGYKVANPRKISGGNGKKRT